MHLSVLSESRPEAMADVPGICEMPLTRAVVQYRDIHELGPHGGRISDIGLALILEGRYASSAEAVDLGSAQVKVLDLSAELVILDWVYEPTLEHVGSLVAAHAQRAPGAGAEGGEGLESFCFQLAMRLLGRVGFGPLTRPSLLRIGFRDICRDLDLHEGTSVRIVMEPGRITRAHLDYDACALLFRTAASGPDPLLEEALEHAFPDGDLRRLEPMDLGGGVSYHVRFPLPLSLAEARRTLRGMRLGLGHLLARFEPGRYRSLEDLTRTFGIRDTLAQLKLRESRMRSVPVRQRVGSGPAIH